MKNTGICIAASLVGGMLVGTALTLLLTPKSGPEMRQQIRDLVERETRHMREKAERMREALDDDRDGQPL